MYDVCLSVLWQIGRLVSWVRQVKQAKGSLLICLDSTVMIYFVSYPSRTSKFILKMNFLKLMGPALAVTVSHAESQAETRGLFTDYSVGAGGPAAYLQTALWSRWSCRLGRIHDHGHGRGIFIKQRQRIRDLLRRTPPRGPRWILSSSASLFILGSASRSERPRE